MKKRTIIFIYLLPLYLLAGVGLSFIVSSVLGKDYSFTKVLLIGLLIGILMVIIENKAIRSIFNKDL